MSLRCLGVVWVALAVSTLALAADKPLSLRGSAVAPVGNPSLAAVPFASGETDLFVVQLAHASNLSDAAWLREAGATPLATVPVDGWLCRLDRAALRRLEAAPLVARIEHVAPHRRVAPALTAPFAELAVRVELAPDAVVARALARWKLAGVRVMTGAPFSANVPVVRVTPTQLAALARDPDVLWIDLDRPIVPLMEIARTSSSVPTGRGTRARRPLHAVRLVASPRGNLRRAVMALAFER